MSQSKRVKLDKRNAKWFREYTSGKKGMAQIAEEWGVTKQLVSFTLIKMGKPRANTGVRLYSDAEIRRIQKMKMKGLSFSKIAEKTDLSIGQVAGVFYRYGVEAGAQVHP